MDDQIAKAREEADARIVRAAAVVCETNNDEWQPTRDYTEDELDELFAQLTSALVQLGKLPGGATARARNYDRIREELERRGRADLAQVVRDDGAVRAAHAALDDAGVPAFPLNPLTETRGQAMSGGAPALSLEDRIRHLAHARDRLALESPWAPNDHDAVAAAMRLIGDRADLSLGTVGHRLVKLIEAARAEARSGAPATLPATINIGALLA